MTAPVLTLTAPKAPRSRIRRGGWSWGPVEHAKLRVLSLGAGVQSTTLALMAAHGEIGPMPDCAIFADTGDEKASTLRHLDWLRSGNVLPFPVHIVAKGERLSNAQARQGGIVPFFTAAGRGGRRSCTKNWKGRELYREQRRLLGFRPRQHIPDGLIEVWTGFSVDEVVRAGAAWDQGTVARFPLLERSMTRQDCIRWLIEHEYPVPVNSACRFCPFQDDVEWARIKRDEPDEFAQACAVDVSLRLPGSGRVPQYVHRSGKPLAEVDLSTAEERGQGNMLMVCEAGCGL